MAWYEKVDRATGSVPSLGRYFDYPARPEPGFTIGKSSELVLHLLADKGPMPVPELAAVSRLSLDDLLESLTGMTDLGLVAVKSDDAVAELTDPGRRLLEQYAHGPRWEYR